MIRNATGIAALAALVAIGGCGHKGSSPSPAPVAEVPCTAHVASQDLSQWKAVAADSFTFCVPREWRVQDGSAAGLDATLTWGTGAPIAQKFTVLDMSNTEFHRFSEDIGGHSAVLWENRIITVYLTGARWTRPQVWIEGETRSLIAADVELTIFRTVRFPSA